LLLIWIKLAASGFPAEITAPCAGQQRLKRFAAQVHQLFVVPGLEVHIGEPGQGFVEQCLDAVGGSEWWHRSRFAVLEQAGNLVLARQFEIPMKVVAKMIDSQLVVGRDDNNRVAGLILYDHSLGDMVFRDMGRFSCFMAGFRVRVQRQVILCMSLNKIPLLGSCNGHGRTPCVKSVVAVARCGAAVSAACRGIVFRFLSHFTVKYSRKKTALPDPGYRATPV